MPKRKSSCFDVDESDESAAEDSRDYSVKRPRTKVGPRVQKTRLMAANEAKGKGSVDDECLAEVTSTSSNDSGTSRSPSSSTASLVSASTSAHVSVVAHP